MSWNTFSRGSLRRLRGAGELACEERLREQSLLSPEKKQLQGSYRLPARTSGDIAKTPLGAASQGGTAGRVSSCSLRQKTFLVDIRIQKSQG